MGQDAVRGRLAGSHPGRTGRWGTIAMVFAVPVAASQGPTEGPPPETVRHVLERSPVPLTGTEVRALVVGASVWTRSSDGGGITVTNREDGTVAAVRDRTGLASIAGTGRWFVREGRYCALLRWQSGPDSFGDGFCVAVHRVGDTYFGIRESDEPDARPIRLRIGGR